MRKNQQPKPSKSKNSISLSNLTLHKLDWLEWLTICIAAWFFIYPKPYNLLLTLLLAIPIIGLLLNGLHKPSMASLVEISVDKDGDDKYDVADFIDIAAWVILIRVLKDYEFESFYSLIIPGTISCIVVLTILFLTHKLISTTTRNKWWIYSSLIFNVSLYSYAGTYAANCSYDFSTPTVYKSEVLNKTISRGRRSTTYRVEVAPWGHHYDKERISVSSKQFSELEVGDTINIDLKEGLFGIAWYFIERKKEMNE